MIRPQMKNLFFDLDGTLTDSRPGIVACIEFALAHLNIPAPADLSWCLGPPLHASFARLVSADRVDEAVALYRQRFVKTGMFENAVYPGIEVLLGGLAGRRLFVATSKPEIYARQIIAHFGLDQHFVQVYGSELGGGLADKTELIASILQRENLHASDVLMIGDREHDIRGARGNGLRSVGVLWGYGSQAELTAAGADWVIERPAEILERILMRS